MKKPCTNHISTCDTIPDMETNYTKVTEMTPALADIVELVWEGWWSDEERIDWYAFLDKVESFGFDLGSDMEAPIIKAIKKQVKHLRNSN
jgi:hypothetical protein